MSNFFCLKMQNIRSLTLSCATSSGCPWSAALVFWTCQHIRAEGSLCHLYFVSHPDSKHSQLIEQNSRVAICIYDSTAWDREGQGYQIQGQCFRINDKEKIKKALVAAAMQRFPNEDIDHVVQTATSNWKKAGRCLYEIVIEDVWTNCVINGIDSRKKCHDTKIHLQPFRPLGKL